MEFAIIGRSTPKRCGAGHDLFCIQIFVQVRASMREGYVDAL